jgi:hypothetical protein
MLKGLGDVGKMMKMQREMNKIQKKLKQMVMEGESPGGEVKATVNGEYELVELKIDGDFFKNHEHRKVEKMIMIAVNEAVEMIKDKSAADMKSLTAGIDIPNLFNKS